jgi:hypothetical protein
MAVRKATHINAERVVENYHQIFDAAEPSARLALLKKQRFTAAGRAERIAASLAALNAPQPTDLSLVQWKAILEEKDDEE